MQGLSREWGKCMVLDNTCQGCQKFAWQTLPFVFSVRSKSRQGIRDRPRWDQPKNRGVVETPRPQTNASPFSQFRNCENRDVCEVFRFREILGRVCFLICARFFWWFLEAILKNTLTRTGTLSPPTNDLQSHSFETVRVGASVKRLGVGEILGG